MKKLNQKSGFTLLELVIALGIFMIFMVSILNTFITLTSTQQKANLSREGMSEAKEILNYISVEAREKRIDYSCQNTSTADSTDSSNTERENALSINCLLNDTTQLVLISNDGLERILIDKVPNETETNSELGSNGYIIQAKKENRPNVFSSWSDDVTLPLHSSRLKVKQFTVRINPIQDPYNLSLGNPTQGLQHPVAQIVLEVERNARNINDDTSSTITIQTSVASRAYNSQEI